MRTGRIFTFKIISIAFFIGLCMSLSPAQAAIYYLDKSNDLDDDINYLMVTINENDSDIDFVVEVLSDNFLTDSSTNFGMQSFSFNFVNTLTVNKEDIDIIYPSSWTISKNQNAGGGFGKFEFQLIGNGKTRTELLTFSITGVDEDTAESYAVGSSLNPSSGEFFAAHVGGFDETNGVTSAQFSGSTPFTPDAPVPIPSASLLLCSGLISLVGLVRRKEWVPHLLMHS